MKKAIQRAKVPILFITSKAPAFINKDLAPGRRPPRHLGDGGLHLGRHRVGQHQR